jgi:carbonic anhydrase/acetyltransferase-like protein (isoleucine patch superfamily)
LSGASLNLTHRQLLKELHTPHSYPAVRPNTPVLPFGTSSKFATFIDPSSRIRNGRDVIVGVRSFIGFYTTLDASHGHIKIGGASSIENNATIVANRSKGRRWTNVFVGDNVLIGYNAKVIGPSTIGGYGTTSRLTSIGPGAEVDQATIQAGAHVGALARVGPGVTLPSGYYVLPGANVTTNAEASDPSLGKVRLVTATDVATVTTQLNNDLALASGYTTVYQGNSATGANPGVAINVTGINNGNLAGVLGSSQQPGATAVSFEPATTSVNIAPRYPAPHRKAVHGLLSTFPLRVTGGVTFSQRAVEVAAAAGRGDTIAGDIGQPITIGSIGRLGDNVTIVSAVGGALTIGRNFRADGNAVLFGSKGSKNVIGDNVSVGTAAVVMGSSIGSGTIVGAKSYVLNSTFAAGSVIAPNSIYVDDILVGSVQW